MIVFTSLEFSADKKISASLRRSMVYSKVVAEDEYKICDPLLPVEI